MDVLTAIGVEVSGVAVAALTPLLARMVPIAAYTVVSGNRRLRWRLVWIALVAAIFGAASWLESAFKLVLIDVALANVWLLFAAMGVHYYAGIARRASGFSAVIHLAVLAIPSLLLPLRFFPSEMSVLVGPLGWEFWLSSYSYVHRTRTVRVSPFSDGLFFLLVNPMLVFHGHRERQPVGRHSVLAAIVRITGGYIVLASGLAVWTLLSGRIGASDHASFALAFLLSQYATHSGRASQDVGLLSALGYPIPERYRYPLLSSGPQDFWQRWNIYLGDWARKYLLLPLSRSVSKAGLPTRLAVGVGVLLTFLTIGLMHDIGALWQPGLKLFGFALWFSINGLLVLLWRLGGILLARLTWAAPCAQVGRLLWLGVVLVMASAALQLTV